MLSSSRTQANLMLIPQLLSGILKNYAPGAELLLEWDGKTLEVTPEGTQWLAQPALDPPQRWLEDGSLEWLSHDGRLAGLLWSPAELPAEVLAALELMVTGAAERHSVSDAELLRLLTQFPQPLLWLDHEGHILSASRAFLETFGLTEDVLGTLIAELPILGKLPEWLEEVGRHGNWQTRDWVWWPEEGQLQPAAELPKAGAGLWLRGSAQPFYTSTQSGTLVTLQDVSAEYRQRLWTQVLLTGLSQPAAVVTAEGGILQANDALLSLSGQAGRDPADLPNLAALPSFTEATRRDIPELLALAAESGAALGSAELDGETYQLELRRSQLGNVLVAQFSEVSRGLRPPPLQSREMLQSILNRQPTATLLIDGTGHLQLLNEAASKLLGIDAAQLVGRSALRQLQRLGVRLFDHSGEIMPIWKMPLPYSGEAQLETPGQGRRPVELGVYGLNAEGQALLDPEETPEYLMVTLYDLSELRRAQEQLDYGISHDGLTGLLNRPGLRQVLAQAGVEGVVAALQFQNFSELSSVAEPTALHHLLMQLAASLRNLASVHGGEAARLGEGLFAVWLPQLSLEEARDLLRPVLDSPYRLGKEKAELSFALGLAAAGTHLPEVALSNAETAAQVSLREGQGKAVIYREELRERLAETFRLEQSLRDAVNRGSLGLHFQPSVALRRLPCFATGDVVGAEALLRWKSGDASVSPYELLAVADRIRVLRSLSDWVLREAGEQQRAWNATWPLLHIAVNLSLEELRQREALEVFWPLLAELKEAGRPSFTVELHTTSTLEWRPHDLKVLEQLRDAGANIWLDNFGEGALSLSALTQLPLAGIKLHPSLVKGLEAGSRQADLVAASADIAGRLGLKLAAVGVETERQLQLLTDLGCDLAQGYAIAPPMAAPDFENWMRERAKGAGA